MKVSQKQIEDMIVEIAGPAGLPVYKALKGKENVNEFLIAEKLKLTINQIRNILYKFDAYNLVENNRKKDRKKGWYIYFWTILPERADKAVILLKKQRLEKMQARLEREQAHQFYMCPNRDSRSPLEQAMEQGFICQECGALLGPDDNKKTINRITKEISTLQYEITELEKTPKRKPTRVSALEQEEEGVEEKKIEAPVAPVQKKAKKATKKKKTTKKKAAVKKPARKKKAKKKTVKAPTKKVTKKKTTVKKKILAIAKSVRRSKK